MKNLLMGGPHAFSTGDCRSRIQRALTRKTLVAHRRGRKRKTLLDHIIERAQGHPVSDDELAKMKTSLAEAVRGAFNVES